VDCSQSVFVVCGPQFVFVRMFYMKTERDSALTRNDILFYALAYLLWLVNIMVCVIAVIQLRSTVNALWVTLGGDRYALGLVNQLSLLLSGFIAFVYIVYLESYYRESVTSRAQTPAAGSAVSVQARLLRWLTHVRLGILLRRFAITTAIPLGVWSASLVALEVALRILR
jgi:hypothetical protein